MERLTDLGKKIKATDPLKIKLDRTVKSVLAFKPLLARIFKEVVTECSNMSFEQIEGCIEGEVLISEVPVDDLEMISGLSTENSEHGEEFITYDVLTYLKIPQSGNPEYIKLIMNVESQNEDKPGYDISLRALFYCARMISAQQGKEFSTHADDPVKYGNIKKVYSIWICTETAQKRANSIEKYDIRREFMVGSNDDNPRYDIMNAILINISEKHDTAGTNNATIKLLTDLFDERIPGEEKVTKLQNEYGLPMTKDYEEVLGMCTYADAIERKGILKGIEKGREEGRVEGRAEGRAEGRVEGRAEGRIDTLVSLVKDGLLSLGDAAKRADLSIDEFRIKAGM
ncbi:MAG: hypothetical protein J5522_10315 [Lachnospiraceae bacterium]|nr:hypothetical protein [Lachnospiraceae bacterium]